MSEFSLLHQSICGKMNLVLKLRMLRVTSVGNLIFIETVSLTIAQVVCSHLSCLCVLCGVL